MKKFVILVFTLVISLCSFGQKHYFTNNPAEIFEKVGVSDQYIFDGEYVVFNYDGDTIHYLTTQDATILINDVLGYYSIIFLNSDQLEVYEFEYKKVEWQGDILTLESKDIFGVKVAILAIWDYEGVTNLTLWWYNKSAKDTLLYYIILESNPTLW